MTDSNKTVRPWTPGEWEANGASVVWVDSSVVANVYAPYSAEMIANARLIAAAPDLYAALKGVLYAHGSSGSQIDLVRAYNQATAALRKANPAAFEAPGHD